MVQMSQRDGLGSANQARRDRTNGTKWTVGIPAVGQRGGMQGRGSGGSPWEAACSGVWVCCVTLTWFHGRTGGAGEWRGFAPPTTLTLFGPRDDRNCSFIENLGTAGCWASGGTERKGNKGFTTRPSSGGRSGAVTISWRAVPIISGLPVLGHLALGFAAPLSGGLDGLGTPLTTGSNGAAWVEAAAAAWERGQPQGVALGDEQAEVLLAAEWMQQRTAVAGCDWSPQTASVQPRTAGRSFRPRRSRGRSGTRGN